MCLTIQNIKNVNFRENNSDFNLSNKIVSKIVMYELWYDYLKPKYGEKELCYMNTDSFQVNINTEDIYIDIKDVERRLDISN